MLKLNKRKKSPRSGLGKSLENLCIKFEESKARGGRDVGADGDPSRRRKKRATKRRSAKRDPAVKRRKIRRPFIRSAVGPWRDGGDAAADPSWFKHPRLHAKAAKKGVRRKKRRLAGRDPAVKRKIRRPFIRSAVGPWRGGGDAGADPSWFKHPRLHAKAAKKGARRRKRAGRDVGADPSWFGHPRLHAKAAKKGARRRKAVSRGKKRASPRSKKRRSPAQIAATKRMMAGLKRSQGRSPSRKRKASPTRRRAPKRGMSYRDAMRGL